MLKNTKYLLLIFFSFIIILLINNNYFMYENTIVKVIDIKNIYSDKDETINQEVKGIIKNGKYKDKIIMFNNETSFSNVYDDKLHKNSEVLVTLDNNGEFDAIIGVKRDKYLVILFILFVDLIVIIGKKKGIKSLFSLIVNIVISISTIYLYLYEKINIKIFPLFIILSIIFIILSLIICHEFNKKTLIAIISSIVSLLISFLISYIVLEIYTESIFYWNIDYIEIISDYKGIFYINILLSGLGAIMDIAITIASSLSELINKNKNISIKDLKKSGDEISKDILGTMINVMLFTCYVSIIPIVVLAVRNSMPLANAVSNYGQIEMIRVLTSSISIVLAIPISKIITIYIYRRKVC